MPDKPLSQRETAILLLLMAEAREFTNPELEDQYGFEIKKPERERLQQLGFIAVGKRGRSFTHTLTEDGWKRANTLFSEGIPMSIVLAPRVLEAVVRAMVSGLNRHMQRNGSRATDIFGREPAGAAPTEQTPSTPVGRTDAAPAAPVTPAPAVNASAYSLDDIETMIRKEYAQLADKPNVWVSLTRLRPLLGDAPRDKVDATLRQMIAQPDVHIVPESNQKSLTDDDRNASVVIGDQSKHLIMIGAR
ncbi:hypothetical protein [Microbispora amethystogenes]|uniref:Uncharacterized protein n=1 Tax=Microbispora amethystogenes TaxID=1427754 RepID=A0ABQ4F8T6_9ACTN|nr:hypothetical protein [Microbispora amethystogenes]GIH31216.1 hypothetical protein Mam01_13800 [Microbispora amethystogenes]